MPQPENRPDDLLHQFTQLPNEWRYGINSLHFDHTLGARVSEQQLFDSHKALQDLVKIDNGFLQELAKQEPINISSQCRVRYSPFTQAINLTMHQGGEPQRLVVYELTGDHGQDVNLNLKSHSVFLPLTTQTGRPVTYERYYRTIATQDQNPADETLPSFNLAWEALYIDPGWFNEDASVRVWQNLLMRIPPNQDGGERYMHRQAVTAWPYKCLIDDIWEKEADQTRFYRELLANDGLKGSRSNHIVQSVHFASGQALATDYRLLSDGAGAVIQHLVWQEACRSTTDAGAWLDAVEGLIGGRQRLGRKLRYHLTYGAHGNHRQRKRVIYDLKVLNGHRHLIRGNYYSGPFHINNRAYASAIEIPAEFTDLLLDRFGSLRQVQPFETQAMPAD